MHSRLESFFKSEADRIYSFAFRILGRQDYIEDCVQEAFLAAIKSKDSFREDSSLETWFYSILRNKCFDLLKTKIKLQANELNVDLSDFFAEDGHWLIKPMALESSMLKPDKKIELSQLAKIALECLKHLPNLQRLVFAMSEFSESSRKEICNETGLSATNVGVVLFRARNSLRNCVESKS